MDSSLNFMSVPSPRAMKRDLNGTLVIDLPNETWCTAKAQMTPEGKIDLVKGTTMCRTSVSMFGHDVDRRLAALDYIRANFCAGLPEPPPPPPPKPY